MGMIQLPKQFNPDFAVPGKKPVGPVEIDWLNPIANGLTGFWLFNDGRATNLVTGKPSTLTSVSSGIVDGEQALSATSQTSLVVTDVAQSPSISVISHQRFGISTAAGDDALFGTIATGPNRGFELMRGASAMWWAHEKKFSINNTTKSLADNEKGVFGFLYSSADGLEVFFNDQSVDTDATNGSLAVANNLTFYNRGDQGGDFHSDGDLFWAVAFNRRVSNAEYLSIYRDPYQLLKPANAPVYFPAAAAGGGSATGTADFTLAGLTTTSTGDVDISGTSDITLDALTTTSAGVVGIEGNSSITFDSLTVTGQGAVDIDGTSDITFDTLTTTGQGFVGNPPAVGTADFTLAALTTTSLGAVDVSGTSDNTFDALTTTTAGSVDVEGTSSNTFDGLSLSSAGSVAVEGTSSNTFADLTLLGQGTTATIALGTADLTFDGLTVTSVGDVAVEGTSSADLDSLTTTTNATVSIAGTSINTLDALTVTASASGLSLPRIDGLFNQVINTDGGSVRMYFNGTDYFTL